MELTSKATLRVVGPTKAQIEEMERLKAAQQAPKPDAPKREPLSLKKDRK